MSSFLKGVDQRTSLAGMNRMELLLFTIKGEQLFGINVFKVREVIRTPAISPVPKADRRVVGVSDIRGLTMPMIDLAKALDLEPVSPDKYSETLTIVTEFNSSVQGFWFRTLTVLCICAGKIFCRLRTVCRVLII